MAITERYVTTTGTDTYANSTNIATPMSFTTAVANAAAGDRINIKVGTYSRTTTVDTVTNNGTITSPIIFRGYSGTIGDGYLGRTNGSGALITTNMPLFTYTTNTGKVASSNFMIWESINITGAPSTPLFGCGSDNVIKSCKVESTNTGAGGLLTANSSASIVLFDSDFLMSGAGTGIALTLNGAATRLLNCRVKGGAGTGTLVQAVTSAVLIGNVIYATGTGAAIAMATNTGNITVYGNTIVGNGGDAINVVTGTTHIQCFMNNIITDNTGDAIDMVSTSNGAFLAYNRTRDNGSALANGGDWTTATTYSHVTTDTGGPETDYVDSSTNDYRLIAASPAIATGFYPYMDIGGIQRIMPTGSGASYTYGG